MASSSSANVAKCIQEVSDTQAEIAAQVKDSKTKTSGIKTWFYIMSEWEQYCDRLKLRSKHGYAFATDKQWDSAFSQYVNSINAGPDFVQFYRDLLGLRVYLELCKADVAEEPQKVTTCVKTKKT